MAYVKIIYQDSPSTATPLNAQNLNHMDDGIAENDRRLNELATAGVVNTFNGRRGVVVPESGDYTADMIPYDEENSVGDILGNATSEIDGITVANASGESFALVPTSEGNALATHIFGMSTQNGTPTPSSPVDIVSSKADFRCVGKNLNIFPYKNGGAGAVWSTNGIDFTVNADGSIDVNGTATADAYFRCGISTDDSNPIYLERGKQYILSRSGNANIGVRLRDSSNTGVANATTEDVIYQCLSSGKYYILLSVPKNSNITHVLVKPMLCLADVEDSTYEPYKHTDITTDLTLRAIEVTSSDNYNLVRDGKYYIADTVDWSEDDGYVLTRRIKESVIDGSSSVSASTDGHTMTINNLYAVNECINFVSPNNRFKAISGGSNNLVDANSKLSDGECIKRNNKYTAKASDYFKNTSMNSVSDWETWLASNPITVYDILATPTTEPITSEQAQSLLSLKTYDVSTSINAKASPKPTVELEYAKTQTTALALSGHNEALIAQEFEGLYGAKNLIYYPYNSTSGSNRGIDFTVNNDGSVSFSGTPNASGAPYYRLPAKGNMFLKAGTYIASADGSQYGCISVAFFDDAQENTKYSGTSSGLIVGDSAVLVYTTQSGEAPTTTNPCGYSKQFTIGSDAYLSIQARTVNNSVTTQISGTYKPMIRLATNTSNTYQPYAMSNYELTQKIRELETAIIELGGN